MASRNAANLLFTYAIEGLELRLFCEAMQRGKKVDNRPKLTRERKIGSAIRDMKFNLHFTFKQFKYYLRTNQTQILNCRYSKMYSANLAGHVWTFSSTFIMQTYRCNEDPLTSHNCVNRNRKFRFDQ